MKFQKLMFRTFAATLALAPLVAAHAQVGWGPGTGSGYNDGRDHVGWGDQDDNNDGRDHVGWGNDAALQVQNTAQDIANQASAAAMSCEGTIRLSEAFRQVADAANRIADEARGNCARAQLENIYNSLMAQAISRLQMEIRGSRADAYTQQQANQITTEYFQLRSLIAQVDSNQGGYPAPGPGYPPPGPSYPPQGPSYPPQGPSYPPQGPGYPGGGYPQGRVQSIHCKSDSYRYNTCYVGSDVIDVRLRDRDSHSSCELNRSYGVAPDRRSIWVDKGCEADFDVTVR